MGRRAPLEPCAHGVEGVEGGTEEENKLTRCSRARALSLQKKNGDHATSDPGSEHAGLATLGAGVGSEFKGTRSQPLSAPREASGLAMP